MTCMELDCLDVSYNKKITDRALRCLIVGQPIPRHKKEFMRQILKIAREEPGEKMQLSYTEMVSYLQAHPLTYGFVNYMLSPDSEGDGRTRFRQFDADHGGTIDYEELQVAVNSFCDWEAQEELKVIQEAVRERKGASRLEVLMVSGCVGLTGGNWVKDIEIFMPRLRLLDSLNGTAALQEALHSFNLGGKQKNKGVPAKSGTVSRLGIFSEPEWRVEEDWTVKSMNPALRSDVEVEAEIATKRLLDKQVRSAQEEERQRLYSSKYGKEKIKKMEMEASKALITTLIPILVLALIPTWTPMHIRSCF